MRTYHYSDAVQNCQGFHSDAQLPKLNATPTLRPPYALSHLWAFRENHDAAS
jgi:hypothetical protein